MRKRDSNGGASRFRGELARGDHPVAGAHVADEHVVEQPVAEVVADHRAGDAALRARHVGGDALEEGVGLAVGFDVRLGLLGRQRRVEDLFLALEMRVEMFAEVRDSAVEGVVVARRRGGVDTVDEVDELAVIGIEFGNAEGKCGIPGEGGLRVGHGVFPERTARLVAGFCRARCGTPSGGETRLIHRQARLHVKVQRI